MRRPTLLNIPGLRSSSVDERTSDGVEGGKRKWVPPDGTGGALWGTPRPVRKQKSNRCHQVLHIHPFVCELD